MKITLRRIICIIASILAIVLIIFFSKDSLARYFSMYSNAKTLQVWIKSFGILSPLIFIILQLIQVTFFFIPGEVMQAAGGYVFGTLLGTTLSITGILLGSLLTFILARKFEHKLLGKILPKKDYDKIKALICKPRNKLIIFILYLLPGFPKDILGYVAGITTVKLKDFVILSTIARLPGILISSYVGSNLYSENYLIVVYTLIVTFIVLAIGFINRKKVIDYFK